MITPGYDRLQTEFQKRPLYSDIRTEKKKNIKFENTI